MNSITKALSIENKQEIIDLNSTALSYLTKDLSEICKVFDEKYALMIDKEFINHPNR